MRAGAAAWALRGLLNGPSRPARVLGAFPSAVYLAVPDPHTAEGCAGAHRAGAHSTTVALLTSDAVRLPNGIVLTEPSWDAPFAAVATAADSAAGCDGTAVVGEQRAVLMTRRGPLAVHARRWWRPTRPLAPRSAETLRDRTGRLAESLSGAAGGLPPGAAEELGGGLGAALGDTRRADQAVAALVGLGPGLTPSGDDIICGWLLAADHLIGGSGPRAVAAAAARRATAATTTLSAALLAHAARGEACPQAVYLLDALGGHRPLGAALAALRGIGHTSGTDLALGVLAAARAAAQRPQHTRRITQAATPRERP